jgi:hypothetical protein
MTRNLRRFVLRANALYIGVAGFAGLLFDIRGILYGLGPQGKLLESAPHAGIGFVEAHGLAVILAIVVWNQAPARWTHLAALAMAVLLGTANLAFWEMFVATGALTVGYVTTTLHWTFVAAQSAAWISAKSSLN